MKKLLLSLSLVSISLANPNYCLINNGKLAKTVDTVNQTHIRPVLILDDLKETSFDEFAASDKILAIHKNTLFIKTGLTEWEADPIMDTVYNIKNCN